MDIFSTIYSYNRLIIQSMIVLVKECINSFTYIKGMINLWYRYIDIYSIFIKSMSVLFFKVKNYFSSSICFYTKTISIYGYFSIS